MSVRSWYLLLALLVFAALGFTLWSNNSSAGRGDADTNGLREVDVAAGELPQGHVFAGITEEPDNVNPFTSGSQIVRRFVLAFTHDALLDDDPRTGAVRPALATSWRLDDDSMGAVFTLRDGVVFADGSPLTIADVMFGWELAAAGHLAFGAVGEAFSRVASASAIDERNLHVRWKERHFAVLEVVGKSWLVPQRRFFLDRVAALAKRLGKEPPAVASADFALLFKQIQHECGPGTGPYELRNPPEGGGTWRRGTELLLTRNEHSWRRAARPGTWNLGGVRLLFRNQGVAPQAMAAREIDWCMVRDPQKTLDEQPGLVADYAVFAYDYPQLGVYRVAWNCRSGPCADVRVRRALAMLFDRQALASKFALHGGVAEAFAKPTSPEYPRTAGLPFDPIAARALLREAGYDAAAGTPLRLSLIAPSGAAEIDAVIAGFQQAARDVGVDLDVKLLDFPAYVAERARRTWDGELASQVLRPFGDPFELLHSTGADNEGGFADAEVDRLTEAARAELDAGRRAALWRQVHTRVQELQPMTFLLHPRVTMLFNRHIQGAEVSPLGLAPERFWVPRQHQRR